MLVVGGFKHALVSDGTGLNVDNSTPRGCPLWVVSGHLQCKRACPLYSRKRTWSACQKVMLVASLCLPRGHERLHSAVRNRLGSARRGKKFDQSFRTFNVA